MSNFVSCSRQCSPRNRSEPSRANRDTEFRTQIVLNFFFMCTQHDRGRVRVKTLSITLFMGERPNRIPIQFRIVRSSEWFRAIATHASASHNCVARHPTVVETCVPSTKNRLHDLNNNVDAHLFRRFSSYFIPFLSLSRSRIVLCLSLYVRYAQNRKRFPMGKKKRRGASWTATEYFYRLSQWTESINTNPYDVMITMCCHAIQFL